MSSSAQTEVSTDVNAEANAVANTPLLTGNTNAGPVTMNSSSPTGTDQASSSDHTAVCLDVQAEGEANVNAPVLTGNTFMGPVFINSSSNTAETGAAVENCKAPPVDYTNTSNELKEKLKQNYEKILVGNSQTGHQKYLDDIYIDLYVVENETGGRENDHEVMQIESKHNQQTAEDKPIKCNDMFKVQPDTGRQNRRVLTLGIAGVGKTVSVNKFILDWAEEKDNQEIVFIFPLPFRRLNRIKEEKNSLIGLLNKYFFSRSGGLSSLPEEQGKVMFIFDGLDEYRFDLNFEEDDECTDVDQEMTVSEIITNLLKGQLVPLSLIWITSRPAASSLIPRDYIDQVTEVRGFSDEQKKQYFNKNSSAEVAGNIISHIRKSRSLYIMCHIPVFCWISLTVLQPLLGQESNEKIPTTLTGMYTSYLLCQKQQMNKKYSPDSDPKVNDWSFDDIVLKLGELAFKQLEEGNLIFYKTDLQKCGLDISEGTVFSGLCTRMFQEENIISEEPVYSFVHLSVQEFIAALYVHFIYKNRKANLFLDSRKKLIWPLSKKPLFRLHKAAIERSLQSKNGHLDLFLRFLLGLTLESNQSDLKKLLPRLKTKTENIKETTNYIKEKIEEEKSAVRTINLFHCLNELKDDFVEDLQKSLSSGNLTSQDLSSAQWSGLVFVLLMSEETQEKFELQKYRRSDEALMRLMPVVKNTRRALLQSCNLTVQCCESLSSALQSSNCVLRELELSNNDLQDSGVKLLSDGLKSQHCKLEILRFVTCKLTADSCESLSLVLQSSNCVLRELDLSNNDLQDSGVKKLSDGLKSQHCKLKTLRLSGCMVTEEGCGFLSSALTSNPSHLRELDLSYNHPGDSGVKLLSEQLEDPNYTLDKLNLDHGGEKRITAGLHKYVCFLTLDPNTAHTQLILSEENREVKSVRENQPYPDHPDRFDVYLQVLCRESVCGRCYWEIDWSGDDHGVWISVSYKSIRRKGKGAECVFGRNAQSWCLSCSSSRSSFSHNHTHTVLPVKALSRRIGVFVDHSAGTLIFYNIYRDTMSLIHSVQTTFTEPLYPGFWLYPGSSVKLS
ncbi:NACHT, LRR and PYD domains-containing protein 3-like [Danio rerio]|uniref:NACHT, LRR and PYD domains-containing protein 3-like n=1 Tax=Danio rerio TaxID=7955 RepID=A0AC58JAK6_DANRE